MLPEQAFHQVSEYVWEIRKTFRDDMRVPARIVADAELLGSAFRDRTIEQLVNSTTLPGIVKYVIAMPDFHQGYGFPIGEVVPMDASTGVITPGGVGYDINCGVRLLASKLSKEEIAPHLDKLVVALESACPPGVGGKGRIRTSLRTLNELLEKGARWALQRGLARTADLDHTEDSGCTEGANPDSLSARAKERGRSQIGSLGGGNHFLEIDAVETVYDPGVAAAFGLWERQVVVQIHCGSRGLGHQVCSDYVRSFQLAVRKYGIKIPDRELVCAPLDSPEGKAYYRAMACAANYAFVNRQVLTAGVREAFEAILAGKVHSFDLEQVYDVTHNIAKFEDHEVNGHIKRLCIHRKGATRAFGPGSPGLPRAFAEVGQPVFVPGSMGTASYVLVGTSRAMELTFGSTCHGAGRVMSRTRAAKMVRGDMLVRELADREIIVRGSSRRGLAEEAPFAYKDVDHVVEVVHKSGIAHKVARLVPMAVIKG